MKRFWNKIINPILEQIHAKYIVEVGAQSGVNTRNILEYCLEHDAHMTAIDPFPNFDIMEFKEEFGDRFGIYDDFKFGSTTILGWLRCYFNRWGSQLVYSLQ